jgi:hypothetical protein
MAFGKGIVNTLGLCGGGWIVRRDLGAAYGIPQHGTTMHLCPLAFSLSVMNSLDLWHPLNTIQ